MKLDFEKWRLKRGSFGRIVDVAEQAGISPMTVSNIERGRRKVDDAMEEFVKMCQVVGVNPDDYIIKDTKVITFLSNKGGSTKTTTCANLAYTLAKDHGLKILMIDTDLQQNLSQHIGLFPLDTANFYEAFTGGDDISQHIRPTHYPNIDIVTSHDNMALMEKEISKMDFSEFRMQELLKSLIEKSVYDYIFIDCNPSLNSLNTSILMATDGLIVPFNPEPFGKSGLNLVVDFYRFTAKRNIKLKLLGVIVSKFDTRKRLPKDIVDLAKAEFGSNKVLFNTILPEDAAVGRAQMMRKAVADYDPNCRVALAYKEWGDEFLTRVQKAL